jgi:hypothetical protein
MHLSIGEVTMPDGEDLVRGMGRKIHGKPDGTMNDLFANKLYFIVFLVM